MSVSSEARAEPTQLRLFVEEICCDLCRFQHLADDGLQPEHTRVDREVSVGPANAYADIFVQPRGRPSYIIEVKFGYPSDRVVDHLRRKYGEGTTPIRDESKLILVLDVEARPDGDQVIDSVRSALRPGLELEVWSEAHLCSLIRRHFNVGIDTITRADPVEVQTAIDEAKWRHAFVGDHQDSPLRTSLLWHFGFWKLRDLYESEKREPMRIVPPGEYDQVVIVMADLCSFSSYVRDTPNHEVVRDSMTSYFSKTRHQILNSGGMLLEFVGDSACALFGIPDRHPGHLNRALECARSLIDIGSSVSNEWQRRIDRIQTQQGVRAGITVGDLRIISQLPFSRSHIGIVGDTINLATRLTGEGSEGDIVVSNAFYQGLAGSRQSRFEELEPVEAKNMGSIKAWKLAAEKMDRA